MGKDVRQMLRAARSALRFARLLDRFEMKDAPGATTGAAGMFFFSGAFWLAVTIVFEHNSELSSYAPWLLLCAISIIFGVVLIWIGWSHFNMKERRIRLLLEGKDPDHPAKSEGE